VPPFLKFDLTFVPSKKTEALDASSKHLPSIENMKSISDFVAWIEYWALFNEMRPVETFTSRYKDLYLFLGCNPGPIKKTATIVAELNNISYLKIGVDADIKKISLVKI